MKQPDWYDTACRMAVQMHKKKYEDDGPDCAEMAQYCWDIMSKAKIVEVDDYNITIGEAEIFFEAIMEEYDEIHFSQETTEDIALGLRDGEPAVTIYRGKNE